MNPADALKAMNEADGHIFQGKKFSRNFPKKYDVIKINLSYVFIFYFFIYYIYTYFCFFTNFKYIFFIFLIIFLNFSDIFTFSVFLFLFRYFENLFFIYTIFRSELIVSRQNFIHIKYRTFTSYYSIKNFASETRN